MTSRSTRKKKSKYPSNVCPSHCFAHTFHPSIVYVNTQRTRCSGSEFAVECGLGYSTKIQSIISNEDEQKYEQIADKNRTKLISKELLSTEEILKMGISEDDASLFRMKKFKEAFTLDKWINIPALSALTFETRIIPVTPTEAHSFLAYCRYTQSKLAKTNNKLDKSESNYKENKEKIDGDINALKGKINEQIDDAKWNECGFFAKFNSRSPKDVHEYSGNDKEIKKAFFADMDVLKQKSKNKEIGLNEALMAMYITRAKLLKMHNANDVIDTFSKSFRCMEDLTGTLRLGDEHADISIALRKWNEQVPINGHGEFRCFVHNKSLNAITEYISCVWFKGLEKQKDVIKEKILDFYEKNVKEHVPMDSFVIDFLVLGISLDDEHNLNDEEEDEYKIYIIELNPFYKSAGAGLFDWRNDRELFLNGPCEIRIRNEEDRKAYDYFHPSWAKSYEQYSGKKLKGNKRKNGNGKGGKKTCIIL